MLLLAGFLDKKANLYYIISKEYFGKNCLIIL